MNPEVILSVDQVSKRFCRTLKRSLAYGLTDIAREVMGRPADTTHLRKDEFWSNQDISFQLKKGESLALLGPNGAGKSTLLKMLNGLIRPDHGSIHLRGRVAALIELGAGFNPILTGRENIYVNAAVLGFTKTETDQRLEEIIEFSEIRDFIDTPVQNYSSGMRVRLGFAVAANLDPDIFLIDEVLAVGDVSFRMKCYDHILKLVQNGTSVVLVTHNMTDVARIAQRVIVLAGGKMQYDGNINEGIAAYEETLHLHAPAPAKVSTIPGPRIGKVELFNSEGQSARNFQLHDDISVSIEVKTDVPIRDLRFIIHVATPTMGVLGAFGSPYKGPWFSAEAPGSIIKLRLKSIPLLVGAYQIYVNLYGRKIADFFDQRVPAASFRITGPAVNGFGFGLEGNVSFDHDWPTSSSESS